MEEQYRIHSTYLSADIIDGVCIRNIYEIDDVVILSPQIFYECLDNLIEDETIYTHMAGADEEIFDKIDEEYGIN
jgi:5,10-methenyltetrahydromethanopterin hydrogenase